MRNAGRLSVSLIWFFVFWAGCGNPSSDSGQDRKGQATGQSTLMVFGAASTTNALGQLCEGFQKDTGAKVLSNFASSSALAQQIINGAGAHVFLSANVKWADAVEREGLVARRVDLLGNRLVVIAPADSRLRLRAAADLKADSIDRSFVRAGGHLRQAGP